MSDDESGKPGKLETAGIEFTNDGQPGVRTRKMKPRDVDVTLVLDELRTLASSVPRIGL